MVGTALCLSPGEFRRINSANKLEPTIEFYSYSQHRYDKSGACGHRIRTKVFDDFDLLQIEFEISFCI